MLRDPVPEKRIEDGKLALARFLRGRAGAEALFYLRSFTVEAVPGPAMPEPELRAHLGKCALVQQLETLTREESDERRDRNDDD